MQVAVNPERPTSAKFRENLTSALRVPGVPPEELKTKAAEVWWEKNDGKDESKAWLT